MNLSDPITFLPTGTNGPMARALPAHQRSVERLTRLQADMGLLVRSHRKELRHWQDQLWRQSARLLIETARAEWGLVPGLPARPLPASPEPAPQAARLLPQAHALICRTGCVMDAHHWRDGEQCRRTGEPCDQSGPEPAP